MRCLTLAPDRRRQGAARLIETPNPVGSRSGALHSSHATAKTDGIRASQAGQRLTSWAPHVGQPLGGACSLSSK